MKFLAALFLFIGCAWAVQADTILLKNGDHLTGTIDHSDGKQLTLKTDYAGEITLQVSAIKQVVSEAPVVARYQDQ